MTVRAKLGVHIERVVVHGVALSGRQREQLQRALERELARLWLADPHARPKPAARKLEAPAIALAPRPSPAQLGRDTARSLFALLWEAS
jgi:hypothetical protein